MNGLKTFKKALIDAANNSLPKMYFKDEGGFYTYKLTKDGKLTDPNEMYEYGTLQELSCTSQRMARLIAKGRNAIAVFG